MAASGGKLPTVESLRHEVRACYLLNKRTPSFSDVDSEAWLLRKYLGFVKLKARKGEVSTEPRFAWKFSFMFETRWLFRLAQLVFAACPAAHKDETFQSIILTLDPLLQDAR